MVDNRKRKQDDVGDQAGLNMRGSTRTVPLGQQAALLTEDLGFENFLVAAAQVGKAGRQVLLVPRVSQCGTAGRKRRPHHLAASAFTFGSSRHADRKMGDRCASQRQ